MSSPAPPPTGVGLAMVELDEHECFALLRASTVGRLALVVDGHPEVFPVNYVVDHGTIVFRTAAGTKLAAVNALHVPVAFEIDGYDPVLGEAWSVIAKGPVAEVSGIQDVIEAADLPLFPWQVAPKPHYVCITPDSVTGRRFRVAWTKVWQIDDDRRVSDD